MSKAISEDQRFCFSLTVVIQALSHVWLCDPLDDSMPGFPVLHHFLELAERQVHWISDAIQSPCLLSPPSPPAFNLCQHQGLFQWVGSLHQVAKLLGLQLQHQSFQWIFRVDFLWDWLVCSPCNPKDSQESSPIPLFKSINYLTLSLLYGSTLTFVHSHIHTDGKNIALTIQNFVSKVISMPFNMLSIYVIGFLPRSKNLLILWLQSRLKWFWSQRK